MKVLIFAFVLTYISAINSFKIKKIEGVEGYVSQVLFDSKFNAFVYAFDTKDDNLARLYKLDPDNNIIFIRELINPSCEIFLNNKDELNLICDTNDGIFTVEISIIRINSSEVEYITTVDLVSYLEDNNGNLIFYSADVGLLFLKYNTTEAVLIKNLDNFVWNYDPVATDSNGNTYLAGYSLQNGENQFAVILGDSKENTPEGYILKGFLDHSAYDFIDDLSINSNDELLISITNYQSRARIKKLGNGTITTIYENEGYDEYYIFPSEKRTLVAAYEYQHYTSRITILGDDGESVEVSNSRKNETWSFEYRAILIDEEGNAFIEWPSEEEKRSKLEFLNHTEATTVEVDSRDIKYIDYTVFDGNNNLWIKTYGEVYFVDKDSLKVQVVTYASDHLEIFGNMKKKSSEIYMNNGNAFYVIIN